MKKTFYHLGKKLAIVSAVAVCTLFCSNQAFSQGVSINATGTGTSPDGSAILDLDVSGLSGTNKKGFLAPRVALTGTSDATTIPLPQTALMVYNTATGGGVSPGFYYNSGTTGAPNWISIGGSGSAPTAGKDIDVSGTVVDIEPILNYVNTITSTDGGGLGVTTDLTIESPFLKDLILGASGSEYGRFSSATSGLFILGKASTTTGTLRFAHASSAQTVSISAGNTTTSYPIVLPLIQGANGQAMINNGSGTLTWGTPLISGNATLTNGTIWIGNGSNVATERTMSGDAAISNTGVLDINTNQVDYNEIQQVNGLSVLGNGTNATANVAEITAGTDNQVLRRSGTGVAFGAVNLASSNAVTGILPIGNGGTGLSTLGTWNVFYANGSGVLTPLALGAANQALVSNGPAAAPSFQGIMTNVLANPGDIIYSTGGTGVAGTGTPTILNPVAGGATAGMVLHNNGAAAPTWGKVDLAAGPGTQVTGTLPVVNGGTGLATITTNGIMLGAGTGNVTTLVGTNMQTIRNNAGVWSANNTILNDGTHVGIGMTVADVGATQSILDVNGANAPIGSDNIALNLRMGDSQNLPSDVTQIALGYNGTTNYRHNIRTRHNSTVGTSNSIDFYLWKPGVDAAGALGSNRQFTIFNDGTNSGIEFYGALLPNGAAGTAGQVLASGGVSGVPTWINAATGTLTSIATGTGLTGGPITTTGTISMADMVGTSVKGRSANSLGAPADIQATADGQFLKRVGGALGFSTILTTDIPAGSVTADNGLNVNTGNNVRLGGTLAVATTVDNAALAFTLGGAAASGVITLGSSSVAQTVNVGTGAGVSTVNIANGAAANVVNIDNGASAGIVQIGKSNALTINTSGNVGIGGAGTNTWKLEITGKVKSTGINETSDVRMKKNFASIDGALSKVLAMNGKYYDWRTTEFPNKGLAEGRQVGVIAQEMEKILPEVVATDGEGYKSVEYGHIVPVLIEAIKEQQKIIDGQKSTIDELKASLENVLNRVNIIEKSADLNSSKVEK